MEYYKKQLSEEKKLNTLTSLQAKNVNTYTKGKLVVNNETKDFRVEWSK